MKVRPALPLLVLVVGLLASVQSPRPAGGQRRDLGLSQAPPSAGGRYHALVVGNDDYTSLPKLRTAAADAREVDRVLRESYGFQTKLLLNATRAQIMAALSAYRRELDADASLLIYYAGHGYRDDEADKAYWLPVDATREDVSNWIIADQITTGIRVVPARHVLVVSDSCYSGTLTRGTNVSPTRPSEREQFLQKMAAGRSRTLMASGGDEPVADGGGSGHSVFAAALLRGLREMDRPRFTASELFASYVVEPVAGRADQTPVYNPLRNSGHESGDFVFTRIKPGDKTGEATAAAPTAGADPAQQELAFWNAIQNSTDAEDFKEYLARYPKGLYAGIAQRRVRALSSPAKPAPTSTPSESSANANVAPPRQVASPRRCANSAAKKNLYKKFLDNHGGDSEQKETANKAAEDYLSRYGDCPKESDKNITDYVRNWRYRYNALRALDQ
jgi:hypothetical protein